MQFAFAEHLGKLQFLFAERRRRIDAFHFDGKLMTDENFPTGYEPLHVRGLDVVGVEQVAARPDDGRRAVAEAAEFCPSKFRRMLQPAFAVIDIPLARPAFKEYRQGQKRLPFFDSAQQARCGAFADIPLAVEVFIVAFPGGNKVGIDVELITFHADLAIDQGAATGMIGETKGDARFVCHK